MKSSLYSLLIILILALVACVDRGTDPNLCEGNQAPIINSAQFSERTVLSGATITLDVDAFDPDNDELEYRYENVRGGQVSGAGATVTFTAGDTPGNASLRVRVLDNCNNEITASVSVTVRSMLPPTFHVSSVTIDCTPNQCILFYAKPHRDVRIANVEIQNPDGATTLLDVGNLFFSSGASISLQEPSLPYIKSVGTWTFRFIGHLANDEQETFDLILPFYVGVGS